MEYEIALSHVSKIYRETAFPVGELVEADSGKKGGEPPGKVAVDDVTLSIRKGERLGIVGRNGAGKSTLLHMIAGLSLPSAGKIEVTGHVTSIMTLGVGLREEMSGRENIYLNGEIQGQTRAEVDAYIDDIIRFAELDEFIDFPIKTYSTGMKSRLSFSMITSVEPEILIIDEALSAGDAAFAVKARNKIREICERGKIVIIVSHSMQAIEDICNRCLWLERGKVVMDGTPGEVTRAYIDAVHAEDEAALLEKFRHLSQEGVSRDGCAIDRLSLHAGEDGLPGVRVQSEQALSIRIRGRLGGADPAATLRISIIRLDDLRLFDQAFPLRDFLLRDGNFGAELTFSPLILAPNVYRLEAAIHAGGAGEVSVFARQAAVFEVFSPKAISGGRPILLYPVETYVATSTH